MKIVPRFATLLATMCLCAASAHGANVLDFSGGNGTPLTIQLLSPLTYAVDQTPVGLAPYFVFQGVGNEFAGTVSLSGNITYTINAGTAQDFTTATSGVMQNAVTANDLILFTQPPPGVALGDVVTLDPGTLTTTGNFAGAPPTSGVYTSFLADAQNNAISLTNPIPEPSTWWLLATGAAVLALAQLRQRRAK